ncbi:nuclear transport factor 2 family protein [Sphingosinicella terrae]|uniref:nuclear transport factor 2 family protein n=1 Tax=Sphingosinicella terrae TaxID=2172047 RepID=UPI000E0CD17D|nr:nuclear transport factor 2 family protein [Sphingosinicella terrae]
MLEPKKTNILKAAAPALDEAAFKTWLDAYKSAWEGRDPDAAALLFSEDATYQEAPWDAPMAGREAIRAYWARVTAGQRDVAFGYDGLVCSGDEGLCHWTASFLTDPGGDRIQFDGIFRCRFDGAGQVATFREWWHMKLTPAAEL